MLNMEEPRRLAPTKETLRELFLKSGNLCAFPGCNHLMMDMSGVFIGQICHIEAAEKGGPRFNPLMSNEDRRNSSNLMLMCHEHHKKTDNISIYPVNTLRLMKSDHEARFASPERSMLDQIQDWTQTNQPTVPKNMGEFIEILEINIDDEDKRKLLITIEQHINKFRSIPIHLREFFSAVLERIQTMKNTNVVRKNGWSEQAILIKDVSGAFRISERNIIELTQQLENYRVAGVSEYDSDYGVDLAISIYDVDDWPFWSDLIEFCEKTSQSIRGFTISLDFGRLDT